MRVSLYARVSTEEQLDGYSIEAQTRACREYAQSHGWQIVAEYVDEGYSARVDEIAKRPAFQRMMQAGRQKAFDLLIVHKIDRFSRNRRVAFEAFDQLGKAGVGFVSISENMDFSAPWGQFALTMLVGLAQLYSDNLAQETRKGKRERKAQGLYNGLLPFGMVKGADGLPEPDKRPQANGATNHDGLLLSFQAASEGQTDAAVAKLLNAKGYRTTGNRGANLWRKDSVRRMLVNRFYLGDLPDGEGWAPGKHEAVLSRELFERVQRARESNRNVTANRTNGQSRVYSLTGLLRCWHCEQSDDKRRGAMRIWTKPGDQPRAVCYSRNQGLECPQRSVFLKRYEEQIGDWLASLTLPDDIVDRAVARYGQEARSVDDVGQERRRLEGKLERLKELYSWGDLERADYLSQRDELAQRLRALAPESQQRRELKRLVEVVRSAHVTWLAVSQSERNRLLGHLVQRIVVKDGQVVSIIPRPDFAVLVPEWHDSGHSCGSDGERCPVSVGRYLERRDKMTERVWQMLSTASSTSIRALAKELGTSRQTIRRALALSQS